MNQYGSAQIVRNIQIPKAVLAGSSINSRGKLFVLSIGAEYDLQNATYALNDARAFYRHIVGESDRFTSVESQMLVNGGSKPPNRANIQAALKWLQQATPDDTVVVFVAGHGVLQGRDYYFLGTDAQTDRLRDTAVPWTLFQTALENTRGQRVLIVDTCYAQNAFNPTLLKNTADAQIALFSATNNAGQLAEVLNEHRQGALTWALLNGMRGEADLGQPANQQVDLYELRNYVQQMVPQHTGYRQRPEVHLGRSMDNFVLSRVAQ